MSEVAQVTHSSPDGHIPQLRFPQFSHDWAISTIGNLAKIDTGNRDTQDRVNSGKYPFYVRSNTVERINEYAFDGEAILTSGDGVGVGKNFHYVVGKFNYHQRVYSIHNFTNSTNGKFIYYYFADKFYRRVSRLSAKNSVDSVRMSMISDMPISIPAKPEQQKIAAFLTAVDNKIEQLSKKQALLGEYKKCLMQKIFSQAIRFKADDGSDFPDWEDGLLNTLIDNSRKIRYGIVQPGKYDKNGKYLIRGKDYSNGWEIPSEFFKVSDAIEKKYSKTRVKKGDVIVCIVGSVGNVMVIPGWLDGANITQTTARIAPDKNKLNNQYLYFYFQSLVGRNMIHKHTRVGTRPGLNIEDVEKFSILLPSLLEQAKIANFLSSIDNKIEQVGKQLDESKQFKKALLQQMFV